MIHESVETAQRPCRSRCPGPLGLGNDLPMKSPSDAPFSVDVIARLGRGDIHIQGQDATHTSPPAVESMVEQAWRERRRLAADRGLVLFNGAMVRLVRYSHVAGTLELVTERTDYRHFLGTNFLNGNRVREFGLEAYANPLGTSATVITIDGHLLMGRRGQHLACHAGYLHPIGGNLEPQDRGPGGRLNAFASMSRELCEELCIADDEIGELAFTGLIRDRAIHQPEMVFDATLTVTRSQLLDRFDAASPDQEHVGFEGCPNLPEAIVPFAESAVLIAPIAVGGLLLHGRHEWGATWYEDACLRLFGELPPQS